MKLFKLFPVLLFVFAFNLFAQGTTNDAIISKTEIAQVEAMLTQSEPINFDEVTIDLFKRYISHNRVSDPIAAVLAKDALKKAGIPVDNIMIFTNIIMSVPNELKYNENSFRDNMMSFLVMDSENENKESLLNNTTDQLAEKAIRKVLASLDSFNESYYKALAGNNSIVSYLENEINSLENGPERMGKVFALSVLWDFATAKGRSFLQINCKLGDKDYLSTDARIKKIVEEQSKDPVYQDKYSSEEYLREYFRLKAVESFKIKAE